MGPVCCQLKPKSHELLSATAALGIRTYRQAMRTDQHAFSRFAHEMIRRGVFVHPDGLEHWFVSAAHTVEDVDMVLEAARDSFHAISNGGAGG